jgi:hypothetical protein
MRPWLLLLLAGCSSPSGQTSDPPDLAVPIDAAVVTDLGPVDAQAPDLSQSHLDAGAPDAATRVGPWPTADLTVYDSSAGLAGPIYDASPDDAQNIWAITDDTLYLLRPGDSQFHRYTAADGLHVQSFTDPTGSPAMTSLTALAGGAPGEVFVGYYGYESIDPYADTEAQRELGNADKVVLKGDGTLEISRYLFRCDYQHSTCWEDRSPRRMLYAHSGVAAGHLFIGFNHGVSHVFADGWGDHIHVETWYVMPTGELIEKVGEQYGLALTQDGDLWTAGRYGVGLQPWNPAPHPWVDGRFRYAFTLYTDDHQLNTVPNYRESERGAAVTSDGTVWFASLGFGLTSWNPQTAHGNYTQIQRWPQVPSDLLDVVADPDGSLWVATFGGDLLRFSPATGAVTPFAGVSDARRLYLDTTVTPRALYVSMGSGLAVIRAK